MDDDPFNLLGLSSILKRLNIDYAQETSAEKGLLILRKSYLDKERRVTHVISDLNMPGMNGTEFIKAAFQK